MVRGITEERIDASQVPESKWNLIETAPKDRVIILYAPAYCGLPEMQSTCKWDEYAGFCIDELRTATHWMELPNPPEEK